MSIDEGYIKFSLSLEVAEAPTHPHLQELLEARELLYEKKLIGAYPNGIGYGNVSVRSGKGDNFIITGSATGNKTSLTPNDFCEVTSCIIAQNSVIARGPINASSESMTHGAIYMANSDVQCVIHIHSRTLFDRMLEKNLLHTPQEAAFGTPDLAFAIAQLVEAEKEQGKSSSVFVTAGHDEGIIAYGTTISEALDCILQL